MDLPLYTVAIICYNSKKYIEQALDSVYNQTYSNIELIISDDCSTDNTVEIVQKWLDTYGSRFIACQLLQTSQNSGITANCNLAVRHASGEYFKLMAADDMLLPACIENFAFCKSPFDIAFCKGYYFNNATDTNVVGFEKELQPTYLPPNNLNYSGSRLYKKLLICNIFPGAAAAIKRSAIEQTGFFDEQYRMMEDYPFWLKSAGKRLKFVYVHVPGFLYRKHNESISKMTRNTMSDVKKEYYKNMLNFSYYRTNLLGKAWLPLYRWNGIVERMYIKLALKGCNPMLARMFELLSPAYVWRQFLRFLGT